MSSKKVKKPVEENESDDGIELSSASFRQALQARAGKVANGEMGVDKCSIGSLADFRNKYDKSFIVPKKIKEALKMLGKGWLYESDFAREAGVALRDLHAYRDQYSVYIIQIPRENRRVWAGTAELAKQMRDMLA